MLKKIFLNDKIVISIISLNAVVIFIQESGITNHILYLIDFLCTVFFIIEMIVKHREYGFRGYWSDGWNRFDGIVVIISLPSLLMPLIELTTFNFSVILSLRLLRALRFMRVLHLFPNITSLLAGFKRALRQSGAVLVCYTILIVILGIINCSIFKELSPEYFKTPLRAIYSVFRICTVEGWYEIPDSIAIATNPIIGSISRAYFCIILIFGGIIGMSFINSIFVDAMVEDNNDDIKEHLRKIEEKIDAIASQRNME
ncbi:MAG TPA: hypothetical protein DEO38_06825 [Bacteroidales bacterium]|nr:hypothetical protein [Bacteroidales bacterium]